LKIWQSIKENKDWVLIIIGIILVIFSAFNLVNFNPIKIFQNMQETPAVEQESFAPLFIPKTSAEEAGTSNVSTTPDVPERIVIEKIGLDAPVELAKAINVSLDETEVVQFLVPEEFAAGWHEGSAPLGEPGNTVISGHHNAYGKVFEHLVDLEVGDRVILLSGAMEFDYIIANKMILPEKDQPLDIRLDNARWILPSSDERLTLVTCWPAKSNTHRLILVAVPDQQKVLTQSTITPVPTEEFNITTPIAELIYTNTATPVPSTREFIVRNAGRFSVNIREKPDMEGKIIGSFKPGNEASGMGRTDKGDWIYIEYEDLKGWVSAELVQILSPVESLPTMVAPEAAPEAAENQ
jgi:LPXTG-site transpeptidase (sortase) family protein